MHISVSNTQYLDVFAATGIPSTHKIRIQNTSSEPLYVLSAESQPLSTEKGEIVSSGEYSEEYLGELWVKSSGERSGAIQAIDLGVESSGGSGGAGSLVVVTEYSS